MRDLVAHGFTVVHGNTAFAVRVDRDAHKPPGESLEVDKLVAEARDRALDQFSDLRCALRH